MQLPRTLADWLAHQERLHPRTIELGLERVRVVLARLGADLPFGSIIVGGTNGKGSCVAFLEAMLRASGRRVGAYTSPHLVRYNERIRVDGEEVSDDELCAAFARVEAARNDVSLTYFEFGTLAAFEVFRARGIEVAVLEVGMGGRLDAVNVISPLASVVTMVGIDHVEYLGPDREAIGYEKAGIFRPGRPAVCGDTDPPRSMLQYAQEIGARLLVAGRDFSWRKEGGGWSWQGPAGNYDKLPPPALPGEFQYANAAAAIAALDALRSDLPVSVDSVRMGLATARLAARVQIVPGDIEQILDVAHNPDGARVLSEFCRQHPPRGRTHAVLGMLYDKDAGAFARVLAPVVDEWYAGSLEGERGQDALLLAQRIRQAVPNAVVTPCGNVLDAYRRAWSAASCGDRLLVCGSFHTVGAVLAAGLYSAPSD